MKTGIICLLLAIGHTAASQSPPGKSAQALQEAVYTYRAASNDGTGKYYMGREIARVIGPGGAGWLERAGREEEEHSNEAVNRMQLRPDHVVADIGAGTGYYSLKLALRVPRGKVFAVELQEELRDHIRRKIKEASTNNIEVIPGDTLSVNLPASSIDFAFMVDVYHELAWPREITRSIRNCLKPDGKLILMEYKGEDPSIRIRPLHKMTVTQIIKEMNASGFILERRVDALPIQHFLVFRKA